MARKNDGHNWINIEPIGGPKAFGWKTMGRRCTRCGLIQRSEDWYYSFYHGISSTTAASFPCNPSAYAPCENAPPCEPRATDAPQNAPPSPN